MQGIQEEAAKLIVAYSGEKARDIQQHEMEVVNAWRNLQIHLDQRKGRLADSSDLYRFFGMVRDLMNWMSDMTRQMSTQEKPRYVDRLCCTALRTSTLHKMSVKLTEFKARAVTYWWHVAMIKK